MGSLLRQARFEELARALCVEAGKPIKDARGEVTRLIDTFLIAMEECTRNYGAASLSPNFLQTVDRSSPVLHFSLTCQAM